MKAFVIHARRTGYGVVRALRKHTQAIYVADTFRTPVFSSRFVKESFLVPEITQVDPQAFLGELIRLAECMDYQAEKPVVFTGKDDYLLFFSRHWETLSRYFHLSFEADYQILEAVLNKKTLVELAERTGVLVPKTFTDDDPLDHICTAAAFPVVVKPAIKNHPEIDVVDAAFRIETCHTPGELSTAVGTLQRLRQPYVVQEYIPGPDSELFAIGVYSHRGELKAWSACQKLRQFPPSTGMCSYGVTFHEADLVEPVSRIVAATGISGITQYEFKRHDGKFYLLEINPRVWSWHQIHEAVGVNFSRIACEHAAGQICSGVVSPSGKVRSWIFLTMDVLHNRLLNRNVSGWRLLREFVTSDMEAFFEWSDPMPFLSHLKSTLPYMRQELKNAAAL